MRGMTKTGTGNRNHDDEPWSDLNHDLLNSVMMRLGVVDFIAFSGVCKSWRTLSLSNWNMFMASRPPMCMSICTDDDEKECVLEDFEERRFKTIIPHSAGRTCVGLTCGYIILFGRDPHDFWLVNPITKHEFYFPDVPFILYSSLEFTVKAILVFPASISGCVFVILDRFMNKIWFSEAGKGTWNHVDSTLPIVDLNAFKGKIYCLHTKHGEGHVFETTLGPQPKLTKLETKNKNILKPPFHPRFVRAGDRLYVIQCGLSADLYSLQQLDFNEMKWVCRKKRREEFAFFVSLNGSVVHETLWAWIFCDPLQYVTYDVIDKSQNGSFNYAKVWYFPRHCLNVNIIGD